MLPTTHVTIVLFHTLTPERTEQKTVTTFHRNEHFIIEPLPLTYNAPAVADVFLHYGVNGMDNRLYHPKRPRPNKTVAHYSCPQFYHRPSVR